MQGLDINTDGKDANFRKPILQLDATRCRFNAQQALTSLPEVTGQVVRLEADEVCSENAFQQLSTVRQAAKDLRRRKGNVPAKFIHISQM